MATYKSPCIHCGELISKDSRFCPKCASHSPFGYLCPTCLHVIAKDQLVCAGCGRPLHITCPKCGKSTFVDERCCQCGFSLMIPCANKRCNQLQFFENTKCTACGKKLNKK